MPKKQRNLNQPSPLRTIQELRVAAHHLQYERAMLEFTGTRLTQKPPPVNLDYAVMMESFLIHARNINEFFYSQEMYSEKKKKVLADDVIAEDFFDPQKSWAKPQANRLPDDLLQQINDQLSHLTYARKVGQYGDWHFADIQQRLISLIDSFIQEVAPEKVVSLAFTQSPYFV